MASFGTNRILDRLAARRQGGVELSPQGRCGFVLAGTLEQADDERRMHVGWPRVPSPCVPGQAFDQAIRIDAMRAAGCEHPRPDADVFDQRQLQQRGPGPELAHRERRDRLKGGDEAVNALGIETSRAAPHQLERQGIDARETGEFVRGDPGQATEERRRQVVLDIAERRQDDVEVVEEPFSRGRRRFLAGCVFGKRRVHLAKRRLVLADGFQV